MRRCSGYPSTHHCDIDFHEILSFKLARSIISDDSTWRKTERQSEERE